ncbi:MAG: hypothetical protein WAR79_02045 [Melioribacteraceae bacterium]
MEKDKSIFPRIIVDETIVKDYKDVNPNIFDIDSILSIDNDGLYYIDYFVKIREHLDNDLQYKKYIIKMTEMLLEMSKKPNLKEKLEWIFPRYHKMLISVKFLNREELYHLQIEDLESIYFTMKTNW